jgi:ligand-binding sensor domain-containing protein
MIRLLFISTLLILNTSLILPQVESSNYLDGATITGIVKGPGDIWFSTYGQGIYGYSKKDDTWTNFSTRKGNSENDFFYCIAVSKKYIWAGAVDGLYTYDRKKKEWSHRKFALGGEMGNWIRSLCYDPQQNKLWIGRFENLTEFDVSSQHYQDHVLTQNNDAKSNTFKTIKLDGDSLIWFGTESGVYKYRKEMNIDNKEALQYINNKNGGFPGKGEAVSISDMLFESNVVWFGTDEFISSSNPEFNLGGIYVYNRNRVWIRISKENGLPGNGIYALAKTGEEIWASTYTFEKKDKKEYGQGLVLINSVTGKIRPINLNQIKINSSNILCMFFDGENMWIGTDDGLVEIKIANPLARWNLKKNSNKK